MPELIAKKTVTARKQHRCRSCGMTVQPGDVYLREVLKYDGRLYTWISCLSCEAITDEVYLWCGDPEEGINHGDYAEWAEEHRNDPRAKAYLKRAGILLT